MRKTIVSLFFAGLISIGCDQKEVELNRHRTTAKELLQAFELAPTNALKMSKGRDDRELIFTDPGKVEVYINTPTSTATMFFNQERIHDRARIRKPASQLVIRTEAEMIKLAEKLKARVKVPADYIFEGVRMGTDGTGSASWSPRPGGFEFLNMGMQIQIVVDRRDGVALNYRRSAEVEIESK